MLSRGLVVPDLNVADGDEYPAFHETGIQQGQSYAAHTNSQSGGLDWADFRPRENLLKLLPRSLFISSSRDDSFNIILYPGQFGTKLPNGRAALTRSEVIMAYSERCYAIRRDCPSA